MNTAVSRLRPFPSSLSVNSIGERSQSQPMPPSYAIRRWYSRSVSGPQRNLECSFQTLLASAECVEGGTPLQSFSVSDSPGTSPMFLNPSGTSYYVNIPPSAGSLIIIDGPSFLQVGNNEQGFLSFQSDAGSTCITPDDVGSGYLARSQLCDPNNSLQVSGSQIACGRVALKLVYNGSFSNTEVSPRRRSDKLFWRCYPSTHHDDDDGPQTNETLHSNS